MIFCFPIWRNHLDLSTTKEINGNRRTISAGLYRCFDITNALDGDSVLIVSVNELVFKLANLVDENTKLIGDVGHIIVA